MTRRIESAQTFCNAIGAGALAVAICGAVVTPLQADSKSPTPESLAAARLVQEALDAEIRGDAARRAELLAAALEADPDFAPAHWHRGEVKFNGEWRSIADVGQTVSGDPRWAEYRERRRALTGSAAEHLELALWCERAELADEARYHWANVLLADPADRQARERLGLQAYRGGLFTDEEVAQEKERLKLAKKDFDKFKPALVKLCARAATLAPGHEEALAEIAAIDDPAKGDALDYAIERALRRASPELAAELQLAHVAALSNMPQHGATLRLLNYAVLSPSEKIRLRATKGLMPRPATDYVPLLMSALTAPYEADTVVFAAPDGTVRLFQTVSQDGPLAKRTHTSAINLETEGALNFDKAASNPGLVLRGNLARADAVASETRERLEAANAAAAERNKRIGAVLKGATGAEPGESADTWWQAWQDYNELDFGNERPEYKTSYDATFTYRYPQEKPMYPQPTRPGPTTTSPTTASSPRRGPPPPPSATGIMPGLLRRARPACECFAAGTLVWTKAGSAPIESIEVGEMVLAQDPLTGELAYRPVLETSVSEPVPVVALRLPKETIVSTLGHRFWVDGHGWQMAKSLKPQVRLQALGGGVTASTAAVEELTVCHNLVVDGFHTFFVGESRLLVHDKNCPAPNPGNLPGSTRPRDASPSDLNFVDALAGAQRAK
jgi:hypothetical protein